MSNKSKHVHVENELKKLKTFDSSYFNVKKHLKKMVQKIIQYFSQCTDILKGLQVFVMAVKFITGNLKDCLMKN